jgi:hypothetical protein
MTRSRLALQNQKLAAPAPDGEHIQYTQVSHVACEASPHRRGSSLSASHAPYSQSHTGVVHGASGSVIPGPDTRGSPSSDDELGIVPSGARVGVGAAGGDGGGMSWNVRRSRRRLLHAIGFNDIGAGCVYPHLRVAPPHIRQSTFNPKHSPSTFPSAELPPKNIFDFHDTRAGPTSLDCIYTLISLP